MPEAKVNIGTFILEDDKEIHEVIISMPDETGWTNYDIYETPETFLANLDADVNICVIDHILNSGLTGFDVLKKVKEKNKWSYVIVMTGQESIDVVIQYLNEGADKYVSKSGKTVMEYMDDLISKLLIGLEVAKERIETVEAIKLLKSCKVLQ